MDLPSGPQRTSHDSEGSSCSESGYASSDHDYMSSEFGDTSSEREDTLCGTGSWVSHVCTPEQKRRFRDVMDSFDECVLTEACTKRRKELMYTKCGRVLNDEDTGCMVTDRWSMGSRNIVLEIRFKDGIRWVAKICMIFSDRNGETTSEGLDNNLKHSAESGHTARNNNEAYEALRYEFLAMEFTRNHVKLPVPTPHLVFELSTFLGPTACLVMDLVPGIHGSDFFDPRIEYEASSVVQANIRVFQDRVLRSMARTQIRLARYQSSAAGRLGRQSDAGVRSAVVGDFVVEDDPEQDCGFYKAPASLFRSIVENKLANIDGANHSEELAISSRQVLSIVEANLARLHDSRNRFLLSNVDLSARNAIFSCQGRLRALIDVDKLFFVPIEVALQPPAGFGLHLFPSTRTRIWRMSKRRELSYIMQYARMLHQAGIACGDPALGEEFASQLAADKTVVAAGLFVLDYKNHAYNKDWLSSPAISRLTSNTSSPDNYATNTQVDVGGIDIHIPEGSRSSSITPGKLETEDESQVEVKGEGD